MPQWLACPSCRYQKGLWLDRPIASSSARCPKCAKSIPFPARSHQRVGARSAWRTGFWLVGTAIVCMAGGMVASLLYGGIDSAAPSEPPAADLRTAAPTEQASRSEDPPTITAPAPAPAAKEKEPATVVASPTKPEPPPAAAAVSPAK